MIREWILFIAYEACGGRDLMLKKNPFQYNNAIRLIAACCLIHVLQVTTLLEKNVFLSIKRATVTQYAIFIFVCVLLIYLIGKAFSKKMLARAISYYKGRDISKHSKLIAFGYLIANLIVLALIINFNR